MVAGMAMAPAAAKRPCWADAVIVTCGENLSRGSHTTTLHSGAPASTARVMWSYTPLHTTGLHVWTITYGVLVWGALPPRKGKSFWPPSAAARAENQDMATRNAHSLQLYLFYLLVYNGFRKVRDSKGIEGNSAKKVTIIAYLVGQINQINEGLCGNGERKIKGDAAERKRSEHFIIYIASILPLPNFITIVAARNKMKMKMPMVVNVMRMNYFAATTRADSEGQGRRMDMLRLSPTAAADGT